VTDWPEIDIEAFEQRMIAGEQPGPHAYVMRLHPSVRTALGRAMDRRTAGKYPAEPAPPEGLYGSAGLETSWLMPPGGWQLWDGDRMVSEGNLGDGLG
jgi:hypothetical protein